MRSVTLARAFVNALLHRVGLHLTSRKISNKLSKNVTTLQSEREKLLRALTIAALSAQPLAGYIGQSKSQLGQDFFALLANRSKKGGFLSSLALATELSSATDTSWKKIMGGLGSFLSQTRPTTQS